MDEVFWNEYFKIEKINDYSMDIFLDFIFNNYKTKEEAVEFIENVFKDIYIGFYMNEVYDNIDLFYND